MSTFENTGAPVEGTGGDPASQTTEPPAGATNTDTSQSAGPPETIPYARFKEVNDRLSEVKDYEPLAQMGYTADSLRGLAEFEAQFTVDPVETWLAFAENIDALPDDVKDAIARHRDESEGQPPTTPQNTPSDEPPAWAQPLISDHQQRQVQAEDNARKQALDSMLNLWAEADKTDGVRETPMNVKLSFIAAHAGSGTTPEGIVQSAREAAMGYRNEILGNESRPPNGPNAAGSPRPVPPSGAIPASSGTEPKTFEEAREAAMAYMRENA